MTHNLVPTRRVRVLKRSDVEPRKRQRGGSSRATKVWCEQCVTEQHFSTWTLTFLCPHERLRVLAIPGVHLQLDCRPDQALLERLCDPCCERRRNDADAENCEVQFAVEHATLLAVYKNLPLDLGTLVLSFLTRPQRGCSCELERF